MGRASTSQAKGEVPDEQRSGEITGDPDEPELANEPDPTIPVEPDGFGTHVKSLREARGHTQAEVAKLAGLAEDTIRRLEHEDFSPSLRTLKGLVRGLGISLTTLFGSFEMLRLEYSNAFADLMTTRPLAEQDAFARLWRDLAGKIDARRTGKLEGAGAGTDAAKKPTRDPFGRHVRSLRRARRLTQEALAAKCRLSADSIRRIEHGSFSPSLDTLTKLCDGLELERSTLFLSLELGERSVERELADMLHKRSAVDRELGLQLLRFLFEILDELDDGQAEP